MSKETEAVCPCHRSKCRLCVSSPAHTHGRCLSRPSKKSGQQHASNRRALRGGQGAPMAASTGIFCVLVGEAAAEASKLLKAPSHGPCRSHKIVGPARPRPARAAPALASPVVAAAAAPESVATSPIRAPRSGRPSVGHPAWPPGFCHCQATPGSASLPLRRKFLPLRPPRKAMSARARLPADKEHGIETPVLAKRPRPHVKCGSQTSWQATSWAC